MTVINNNEGRLKEGVSLYAEKIDNEELEEELNQDRLLNLLLGKEHASNKGVLRVPDGIIGTNNSEEINHPAHYTQYSFEAIDVIDEVAPKYPVEVAMEIGNAIKYLLRAPFKGRMVQDLKKATWYINRAIYNLEKSEKYDYED